MRSKFTDRDVERMAAMRAGGAKLVEIAEAFGTVPHTVARSLDPELRERDNEASRRWKQNHRAEQERAALRRRVGIKPVTETMPFYKLVEF